MDKNERQAAPNQGANLGVDQKWGSQWMGTVGYPAEDAEEMSDYGRGSDSEIAHVSPGEMVIPQEVYKNNPQLMEAVRKAFADIGADHNEFVVGSEAQKINPVTGQPEFFLSGLKKLFRKVIRKVPFLKTVLPVAAAFIPGIGPIASAAIGAGLGALGGGGLKSAIIGGLGGYGGSALATGLRAAGGIGSLGAGIAGPSLPGTVLGGVKNVLSGAPGALGTLGRVVSANSFGNLVSGGSGLGSALSGAGNVIQGATGIWGLMGNKGIKSNLGTLKIAPLRDGSQFPGPLGGALGGATQQVPQAAPTTYTQGAGPAPYSPSAPAAGVSFLAKGRNRNTGDYEYTEAPFSSALSSARRGGWGNTIFR